MLSCMPCFIYDYRFGGLLSIATKVDSIDDRGDEVRYGDADEAEAQFFDLVDIFCDHIAFCIFERELIPGEAGCGAHFCAAGHLEDAYPAFDARSVEGNND